MRTEIDLDNPLLRTSRQGAAATRRRRHSAGPARERRPATGKNKWIFVDSEYRGRDNELDDAATIMVKFQ